ncbi:DoxX family protein [Thalassococcus sp. CAU 1522]|uniref:DoxX family protein n=1 Tax=Thalassococcus arenae TaxID=2851652 RepID=A0ABS6N2U5_9RHOB|nr:DoxX family protein [Thalassococcus arenae]MBV2358336.1 DoxX family protein [Thalassococcus arenae]
MNALRSLHDMIFGALERYGAGLLPLLARFVFAATLLVYFWNSGLTKLGEGVLGILRPSFGAYAQIFPRQMEAASYDISQFGVFHWAVVTAGTWAEFILPLLIVVGLLTRLAALGMIGFVVVQSLTDLYGHRAIEHPETVGAWFDRVPDSVILDQRAFWMLLLVTLVLKGAGALSIDRLLAKRLGSPAIA